jgi:glutamyl-tRNA reductase
VALSTCNRVEILCAGRPRPGVLDAMLGVWARETGGDIDTLRSNSYAYEGLEAVAHLFTVAASLDSMVMGEPQILGQLKDAYRAAVDKNTTSVILNGLLHKSFSVAKRVRTETAVASSAVSISFAAVELARKIFGDLGGKRAMLIGAGEMAELAATHLMNNGAAGLVIANRTLSRAVELARTMHGTPVEFERFSEHLRDVDIVISSTGSPTAVIHKRDVQAVLKARKNRPMFFIDIAVPRDIDPDVNQLDNVYLYDIDDLKDVVEENLSARQDEAVKARALIAEETARFEEWLKSLELHPTIVAMRDQGHAIARRELRRTLKRIGTTDKATREALETLVLSVADKILHEPFCYLRRRTAEDGSAERIIGTARKFFNLDAPTLPPRDHTRPGQDAPDALDGLDEGIDESLEDGLCAPYGQDDDHINDN